MRQGHKSGHGSGLADDICKCHAQCTSDGRVVELVIGNGYRFDWDAKRVVQVCLDDSGVVLVHHLRHITPIDDSPLASTPHSADNTLQSFEINNFFRTKFFVKMDAMVQSGSGFLN